MLYREVEQEIKRHSASLEQNKNEFRNVQHSNRKPLISFSSDDIDVADWNILKPIFEAENIPITIASPSNFIDATGRLSLAQLKYLQDNLGWEVASHSVTHTDLTTIADEREIEYELKESKRILESKGFKVNSFVYPVGNNNETVRRIAKKYYRNGVAIGRKTNRGVIGSFTIHRFAMGSYFDLPADGSTSTLDYYKSAVDKAVSSNGWTIFMLHPGSSDFNTTQQDYLKQTIQYIKSLNIDIVTINEGYNIFGNALEVGDYLNEDDIVTTNGMAISFNGEYANFATKLISKVGLNSNSPITAFPSRCVSITSFASYDNGTFPTSAGTLHTSRINTDDAFSYQLWYPHNSNKIYKRMWSDSVWQSWEVITGEPTGMKLISKTGLNNASLITTFPTKCVSVTSFISPDGAGFPTNAGTLFTARIDDNNDLAYQLWYPYNSNVVYKRMCSSNTWLNWETISPTLMLWVGVITMSTTYQKIGFAKLTNFIDFEKVYSNGGTQPTLTKTLWASSEISSDSANPTTIGSAGSKNLQVYKDTNNIYIKYSDVGNNYPTYFKVSFC